MVAGRVPDSCGMVWTTVIGSPVVATWIAGAVAGTVGNRLR